MRDEGTTWSDVEIRSLGRVVTGKTPPKEIADYWDGDELFVSPKDMERDSLNIYDTQSKITTKAMAKFKGQVLPKNAVMFTALSFGFGKIGIASRRLITNQQINSVVVNANSNHRFVYYLLRVSTPHIFSFNSGIDTPIVPKSVFEKIKLRVPPLPLQRKIAAVLSAYDDLIENNHRRIALLEKMAEELYREWFVRLRFPGHENVKVVKGVPEGWEVRGFGDTARFINGYPFAPEEWRTEGLPIIKIRELKQGVTFDTPRNGGETIPAKLHVNSGDILFSWSGSLEVVVWNEGRGLLNQHLFKVVPNKGVPASLLFLGLKSSLVQFSQFTTGATMQHIKRKELDQVKLLIPTEETSHSFDQLAGRLVSHSQYLKSTSNLLKSTRDRLLSRLMSGKIDLTDIDIAFPPSMKEEG